MRKIYFLNERERKFVEGNVPEWTGYDTLVETAKDCFEIIKDYNGFDSDGMIDRQPLRNAIDSFKKVNEYYKTTNPEGNVYYLTTIFEITQQLKIAFQYLTSAAVFDENDKDYKEHITVAQTSIRFAKQFMEPLTHYEIYADIDNLSMCDFKRLYHLQSSIRDIYLYNDRWFYKYHGWDDESEGKYLREIADKQFNNKQED